MAEIPERAYGGAIIWNEVEPGKYRRWSAVNITPARGGLGAWSQDDLAAYLGTGFSLRAGTFGPMNKVIVHSLMHLAESDIDAMALYLKELPAIVEHEGPGVPPELVAAGEPVYQEHCAECHRRSGRGGIFHGPPLAGSAIVQSNSPHSLINIILYGADMPDEVSFGAWETMRPYRDRLTDEEIAAVSNFVRGSWGNLAPPVDANDVARQR